MNGHIKLLFKSDSHSCVYSFFGLSWAEGCAVKSICKHTLSEPHGRWMVLVIVYISSVFDAGTIDLFRHANHMVMSGKKVDSWELLGSLKSVTVDKATT